MNMKKRIYSYMLLLSVAGIMLTSLLLSTIFYNFFTAQMKEEVRLETLFYARTLSFEPSRSEYLKSLQLTQLEDRVTLVSGEGDVLFDSYRSGAPLENHAGRPEIQQAVMQGYGEDKRFSETLHEETYYYAIKLEDGSVLRVAKTTDSILSIFLSLLLPVCALIVLILLLCRSFSKRLTRKIVDPINQMNSVNQFDETVYDELAPFLVTISKQQGKIQEQMDVLRERAGTLSAIIENMREGLILLDAKGTVLSANASATRLFQKTPGAVIGRGIHDLTHKLEILDHVKSALGGDSGDMQLSFGGQRIHIFFDPVRHNGQGGGAILFFMDVTRQATAEQIRREFTANVSHELKTPLTTISGLSELIETGKAFAGDIPDFAGRIHAEAARTSSLVDDILKLSQLDEGALERNFEDLDLVPLIADLVSGRQTLLLEKDISISLPEGSQIIKGNKSMLEDLLGNLLDNAIRYNKPQGSIAISLAEKENRVEIRVSDTGIGIAAEHLPRLFERFYRVDKSRSKKTGGTGLGLAIVKHIAQYHHGDAGITSEEGAGTCITVRLPKEG